MASRLATAAGPCDGDPSFTTRQVPVPIEMAFVAAQQVLQISIRAVPDHEGGSDGPMSIIAHNAMNEGLKWAHNTHSKC